MQKKLDARLIVCLSCVCLTWPAQANGTENMTDSGASKRDRWSGFYLGIDGIHAKQSDAAECISGTWDCSGIPITNPMQKASGSGHGAHLGFNLKLQTHYVLGLEASVQRKPIDGAAMFPTVGQYKSSETTFDGLKTLRLRAGRELGDSLIYLTGGLAWSKLTTVFTNRYENGDIINFPNGYLSDSNSIRGHVAGIGLERAITKSLSWRSELSWIHFPAHAFDVSTQINGGLAQNWAYVKVNPNLRMAKLSISYRF